MLHSLASWCTQGPAPWNADEAEIPNHNAKNDMCLVLFVGGWVLRSDAKLVLSISRNASPKMVQSYSTWSWRKRNFLIFNVSTASVKVVTIFSTWRMWSSSVLEKMITSFGYTRNVFHLNRVKTMSSARWKHAGTFNYLNCIRMNWSVPFMECKRNLM